MPAPSIQDEIVTDVQRQITDGSLKPGDRLPTKQQLADRWQCSAQPVTMALARLEAMGLVIRRQGKGTFVAGSTPTRPWRGRPRGAAGPVTGR